MVVHDMGCKPIHLTIHSCTKSCPWRAISYPRVKECMPMHLTMHACTIGHDQVLKDWKIRHTITMHWRIRWMIVNPIMHDHALVRK